MLLHGRRLAKPRQPCIIVRVLHLSRSLWQHNIALSHLLAQGCRLQLEGPPPTHSPRPEGCLTAAATQGGLGGKAAGSLSGTQQEAARTTQPAQAAIVARPPSSNALYMHTMRAQTSAAA